MRDIRIELLTEKGSIVTLNATARRRLRRRSEEVAEGDPKPAVAAAEPEVFPLVVLPVSLPWFKSYNQSYSTASSRKVGRY